MDEYDFLVIGSGSGLDVANVAVNRGLSVAIVEKGPLGGTCLNRGCIPSKMLLYHADVMETVERADEFGIYATVDDVDFADIVREVNEAVSADADSIRRGLRSSEQHELYEGEARFVDDRTVKVSGGANDGARLRAETVLVAAGTRPAEPPIDGIDSVNYLTSTGALQLESPSDRLVIVGGGHIAAELGYFFGTFGSDVIIVGRRPTRRSRPRSRTATPSGSTATRATRRSPPSKQASPSRSRPVRTHAGTVRSPGGEAPVDEADSLEVEGDELLLAAGRGPNSDTPDLAATGVETDERGSVETDEYLRTTADGVWALGDIVGEYLLKHNANHEARAVIGNLFGEDLEPVDYGAMPFAVFASPEVAGVGAREAELRAAGVDYATRSYPYEETARGDAMNAEGLVKVIIDLEGEILGCHIVGLEASNLIEEMVVAMTAGSGTVRDIRESVHIHPALSEVVQRAFAGQFTRPGQDHDHH